MQSWNKFMSVVWFQYVTEVCSNQFIGYMIALQSPYMIALQSPLSSHNWSRDRWQFIDVQRSRFLELKVNNSFILSILLIILKDCAVYFNIILAFIYAILDGRQTAICEYLWDFLLKLSAYINKTWRLLRNYDEVDPDNPLLMRKKETREKFRAELRIEVSKRKHIYRDRIVNANNDQRLFHQLIRRQRKIDWLIGV